MLYLLIMNKRPNLSTSSLKIYMSNLKLLNDKNPINNLKFLSDFEGIMDKIKEKKQNTQKSNPNTVIQPPFNPLNVHLSPSQIHLQHFGHPLCNLWISAIRILKFVITLWEAVEIIDEGCVG